jgi:hypothetical protein
MSRKHKDDSSNIIMDYKIEEFIVNLFDFLFKKKSIFRFYY